MKHLQIILTSELHKQLKQKALDEGTSVSELVRPLLEELVK